MAPEEQATVKENLRQVAEISVQDKKANQNLQGKTEKGFDEN